VLTRKCDIDPIPISQLRVYLREVSAFEGRVNYDNV
jgi:hypothetical protein